MGLPKDLGLFHWVQGFWCFRVLGSRAQGQGFILSAFAGRSLKFEMSETPKPGWMALRVKRLV